MPGKGEGSMADAPYDRQPDEPHNWYCRFEEFTAP
jgi:hypothetical protein